MPQNKIVWIVNHYAQPPCGSVGTRHFLLAKNMQKYGWETFIICSGTEHSTGKQLLASNELRAYEGVTFYRLKTIRYRGNGLKRILNMLQFFLKALYRSSRLQLPTHVVGSTVHPFAALAGYMVAKKHKAKFIYEVRDIWPQTLIDMGVLHKYHPLCLVFHQIDRFLSRKSDKIISLAPHANSHYAIHGVNPEKIEWIPNGVDLSDFPVTEYPKEKDTFDIYYIGAHGKVNALDEIILAAKIAHKSHPHICLHFVGDGPEKKRLQNLATDLSNIYFHNIVAKKDVPAICALADCFVLTSLPLDVYKYGISFNKIFDYMASARPIIFSANAKNNPIEEASCGITVRPGDINALSDAFIKMSEILAKERTEMGVRAREYVALNHNHEKLASRLNKFLINL